MVKKDEIIIPADPNDSEDFDVTAEELEAAHRSRTIRRARQSLDLTQEAFAARFGVSVGTLRDWEQVRSVPPAPMAIMCRVILLDPEIVNQAIATDGPNLDLVA